MNMLYLHKNARRFWTGGSSTYKISASDIADFLALLRHRTMPGRATYGARTVAIEIGQFSFKTKSSGARCVETPVLD